MLLSELSHLASLAQSKQRSVDIAHLDFFYLSFPKKNIAMAQRSFSVQDALEQILDSDADSESGAESFFTDEEVITWSVWTQLKSKWQIFIYRQ